MPASKKKKNTNGRDWTAVRQSGPRKPRSRTAWWRSIRIRFQTVAIGLAGVSGLAFLVLAVSYFTSNPLDVNLAGPSGKLEKLEFQSNGSLEHAWLEEVLDLPSDTQLMDLDLLELKKRILNVGQVQHAELQRRHPDTLRVTVTEHLPVLKIYIADTQVGKKCLLVSERGVVFEGVGHPVGMVAELPILFGGRLLKGPEGFRPIQVVDKIKPLMDMAQKHYPHLLRGWDRIRFDVAQGGKDVEGLIRVRSGGVQEVIFSTEMDYLAQLERLDYVLNYSNREGWMPLALIDLPGRKSATVRLSNEVQTRPGANPSSQTLLF